MAKSRKEWERITRQDDVLRSLGFTQGESEKLRRISMTLQRWHELECGTDRGCIERENDDGTGRAYWRNSYTDRRYPIPDRETGARNRLMRIIADHGMRAGNKKLRAYVQGDPRGAALYIIRPGDVPEGGDVNAYYSRGICVY